MSEIPAIGTDELYRESASLLPRRETLSCQIGCVNVTTVVGVNFAIAINAASANAFAHAVALQYLGSIQT
jgi:hypothetical protein